MLAVKDGVLVKRWESDDGREFKWLLVLPRSLRRQVLDRWTCYTRPRRQAIWVERSPCRKSERGTTG